jgi:alpha-mannosidase
MHRWVDLSEADFGAALLNDGKYGYDAVENMVRLSLLRVPIFPSPNADLGEHRFRYALFVHGGVADLEQVHLAAERFNNAVALIGDTRAQTKIAAKPDASFSFAQVDSNCVTIETVKQAESGNGIVLRIFEHANRRVTATVFFGVSVKSVKAVDLMESGGGTPLALVDQRVTLTLRPFEIATLLVKLE